MSVTDPHPKPTVAVSVLLAIAQIMVWGGSFFMMAMLAGPVVKGTAARVGKAHGP
jgi:hypothetical protein